MLREQSSTKSFIVQHNLEDAHGSTNWVLTQQDEVNELLDLHNYGGVSGFLIRDEYTEAFRLSLNTQKQERLFFELGLLMMKTRNPKQESMTTLISTLFLIFGTLST